MPKRGGVNHSGLVQNLSEENIMKPSLSSSEFQASLQLISIDKNLALSINGEVFFEMSWCGCWWKEESGHVKPRKPGIAAQRSENSSLREG